MWRRVFVALLVVLIVAPLAGAMVPRPLLPQASAGSDNSRRILVLSNPIHTDIALPTHPDVLERLGFLGSSGLPIYDPAAEWLVVGWGGRSFYLETPTWSDLKPLPVLRALTADSSAMHVAVAGAINQTADGVLAIDLSEAEFAAMLSAMLEGFAKDASGEPILIAGRSYGPFDRFYEGVGAFNAVVGCNTWTSAVLRRAGLRTGFWNPLPQSLVWSLRAFNELP
ncbi:TIGR02117 family protein [Mesorhizobium sp. J428]|uniref:TIGR02117 family protein n=1 Tax=Mesorhizobium sp. J428 TaxID=2898440 RepID=UPI00215159C2|nr:TIGR02117 family protein [Mesorhizobium sp. J428]MCR5859154.1 TIGR02117 family protein [Mesorhizobium sp. J428]